MPIAFKQILNQIAEKKDGYKKTRAYMKLSPRMKSEVDKVFNYAIDRKGNLDIEKMGKAVAKSPARRQLDKVIDDFISYGDKSAHI